MQKKWIFVFLLLIAFATSKQSHAQGVRVKASVDTSKIVIGDAIQLTLNAEYDPTKFQVQLPSIPDTFNHFETIEKARIDTSEGRELRTISKKMFVSNYDSGVWMIPKFGFEVKPLQGSSPFTLFSDSISIYVNTVAVDTAKPFKPIFGIRDAKMPLQQIIMYVVGGIVLLSVLIFLIYYLIKKAKEKNKQKPKEPEVILLPHEKALRAFDALELKKLWQQGQEKEYHTELTDIIRLYLEEQFGMDCFEKTSSEIISQVKRIKALSTSRQQLRQLFETADMVKFAKSKPTAEQHNQSAEMARFVILESYKKVKPIEERLPK
jgi:Tfp pilus assembly protein PilN